MERLPVSANKNNLQRLREELSFAMAGWELLEEKKEVLLSHISGLQTKAKQVRDRVSAQLAVAYGHLEEALVQPGPVACSRAALAVQAGEEVEVHEKSFMGVPLPLVRLTLPPLLPPYGFLGTGPAMDETIRAIRQGLEALAELAELEVSLCRLLAEVHKTVKRLNALENIYIPSYQATIKYIADTLEEKEREFLFQLKRQKRRQELRHESL